MIFDCDGTLADTMPAHHQAWLATLAPFGLDFPGARFYGLAGVPTVEIARRFVAEHGLALDGVELARRKEQAYLDSLPVVQPVEKVVAIARRHRGQLPLAVASGSHRSLVETTLRQIGTWGWWDAIVAAEDTTRHKPEPDVFLEAARRLGVPPHLCTVYEDANLGIEAARRAGMRWVDVRAL